MVTLKHTFINAKIFSLAPSILKPKLGEAQKPAMKGGAFGMKNIFKNKRGQISGGLLNQLIMGVAGLVIGVIIAFVIVSTLTGAGLLTSGSAEENATNALVGNFTSGINNVSSKIPTVLVVAAVVLIMGVLALLVVIWKRSQLTGGGSL